MSPHAGDNRIGKLRRFDSHARFSMKGGPASPIEVDPKMLWPEPTNQVQYRQMEPETGSQLG